MKQTKDMLARSLETRNAIRTRYAWPGGYPLYLVMSDGCALCMDCARKEYSLIARATRDGDGSGWQTMGADINYEDGALHCDHCSAHIEAAYAEEV